MRVPPSRVIMETAPGAPASDAPDVPKYCSKCGAYLYADTIFNLDMKRAKVRRVRFSCINDHGLIIDSPSPLGEKFTPDMKLCVLCNKPLHEGAAEQTRAHKKCREEEKVSTGRARGRPRKFKSGFLSTDN